MIEARNLVKRYGSTMAVNDLCSYAKHDRDGKRLTETPGQTSRNILERVHHVLKTANACIAVC